MDRSETAATQAPEGVPRHTTVLKCDAVYATATEQPLDLNGQLVFRRGFEQIVTDIAARHGGYVKALEGDGILILFGFPQSREGAASSALRMSIDLARAIETAEFLPRVQQRLRVGIASGLIAIVKQRTGSRGEGLAGRTMNIAESAWAHAGPGQIIVADDTKRLAGDSLHFEDLGTVQIIGFDGRVRIWQVVLKYGARFDARRTFSPHGVVQNASTPRFPGPGDFLNQFLRSTTPVQDGAQSTYDGSIVITLLDRTLVESVLPAGFSLAGRTDGGQQHPVIHLVGHQNSPRQLQNGIPKTIPGATPYKETILLIPFVLKGSGTNWHNFAVRMYLDDPGAIFIGDTVYGYAKLPADLTESGTGDDLTTEIWPFPYLSIYFRGEVVRAGPWRSSDDALQSLPRWGEIKEIFEMPIVGVDEIFGSIACSYWEWDHTNAEVAPATSQHSFFQPFRDGMDDWVALGPLSNAPDGAVVIRGVRWRLALPPPTCQF